MQVVTELQSRRWDPYVEIDSCLKTRIIVSLTRYVVAKARSLNGVCGLRIKADLKRPKRPL